MKKKILQFLACPNCGGDLVLNDVIAKETNGDVKEGSLKCVKCGERYVIKNFIPRFVPEENYAKSFGFEWNMHSKTQIDKFNGANLSHDRFYDSTNWEHELKNQKILEVGCGAGRFTQIALETGAEVFSFDYSNAVDANLANNGDNENLYLFQADIYKMPFKKGIFDKIFCLGVLQHCPDVKKAFFSLLPYLKKGGEIVIDLYEKTWRSYILPHNYCRLITTRIDPEKLYSIIRKMVPILVPVKRKIKKLPILGRRLQEFIPVVDYSGKLPLNDEQIRDWEILDTFDTFSPKYTNPQTIDDVKNWFLEAGLKNIQVKRGGNGILGKGIKL